MFSLSLHHACRRASALALVSVFAIASARAQQPQSAAHDTTKSKMPEVARTRWATVGLGAADTLNFLPSPLEPYYRSKMPVGTFIFLRLRPFHAFRKGTTDMGGMKMGAGDE
jgi:hypothetical protein